MVNFPLSSEIFPFICYLHIIIIYICLHRFKLLRDISLMKEKILALLTAKFTGVQRKDGLAHLASSLALQAGTDEEAQALVEKLQETQVTDFIKEWRSGVDSEVTTAKKEIEKRYQTTTQTQGAGVQTQTVEDPKQANQEVPAWAKALLDEQEAIKKQLNDSNIEKTINTRKSILESVVKDAPEYFKNPTLEAFELIDFKSEEAFNSYVEKTKATANELALNASSSRPRFGGGNVSKEASKEECEKIASRIIKKM